MTLRHRKILVFAASSLATAGIWALLWPERAPQTPPAPLAPHSKRESFDLPSALQALAQASTPSEKAEAAEHLSRIPRDRIREALDTVPLVHGRDLTLAAKLLLIRWASFDGEAAMQWSWERFRTLGPWEEAYRQVGASWAWSDPKGFGRWLKAAACPENSTGTITVEAAQNSDIPLLDSYMLQRGARWLITEDPATAFSLPLDSRPYSTDGGPAKLLTRVDQIREALSGLGPLDDLESDRFTSRSGKRMVSMESLRFEARKHTAFRIFDRWQEIDPESFAASPYAGLLDRRNAATPPARTPFEEWKSTPLSGRAEATRRLLEGMEDDQRDGTLRVVIETWTGEDPSSVGEWLLSHPEENAGAVSTFARLRTASDPDGTLDWIARLPTAQRTASIVAAFDAWNQANPGTRPDLSSRSPEIQEAWRDLESLGEE